MTSERKVTDRASRGSDAGRDEETVDGLEEELGSDLIEDAFENFPAPTPLVAKKEFKPWHLPRKHYIRIHQWCAEIKALAKQLKKKGSLTFRPLSYLSLPGDELLDIRTIHGVCVKQNISLAYLGFNTVGIGERALESHLSENEVKALPQINAKRSMILNEALEHIANKKSLAYRRIAESGSFDVVNLDLCGSVASQPPLTVDGTLGAVRSILEIQRTNRVDPWILFLTTRVGVDVLDGQVVERLRSLVRKNTESSSGFKQALEECLQIDIETLLSTRIEALSHARFARMFGVGFGKWLLGLFMYASPKWRIALTSALGYSVDREPTDMLSLGFRFELIKEPISDLSGLTVDAQIPPMDESEESLATKMALMIKDIVNIDELLEGNASMREKITEQSTNILTQARYGAAEYKDWLLNEQGRRGRTL